MRVLSSTVARALLADRSFDIEFQGYLSNHAKHAIIALDRLQAPEPRVQEYWDEYTTLTPYGLQLHRAKWKDANVEHMIKSDMDFLRYRGKKKHWTDAVQFLETQLATKFNNDTDQMIRHYGTPDLLHGMAGALTHGIIHLGWAIDSKSPWMILEGLAYLNFAHLGVNSLKLNKDEQNSAKNDATPMESYGRVAETFQREKLADVWVNATKDKFGEDFHSELVLAGFQWHAAKLLHEPHAIATDLPAQWLNYMPLEQLWEHLYKTVTTIYLAMRDEKGVGNFLILHFLTSLWGVEQVLKVIDKEEVTRVVLGQFYASSIVLLATAGAMPTSEQLSSVVASNITTATDPVWDSIVARAIDETEEHNIKLVYVAQELWKRYQHWYGFVQAAESFTATPNIGPSKTAFE